MQLSEQHSLTPENFNLLITTDWHIDGNTKVEIINIANNLASYAPIDERICLGDFNTTWHGLPAGYNYWHDTLLTLGNHDYVNPTGPFIWTNQIPISQLYTQAYEPYISSNKTVQEPNTTYWYKDCDKNIRLIGLDCMCLDSQYQQNMLSWLKTLLNDSLIQNKQVILARHWGYGDKNASTWIPCSLAPLPTYLPSNLSHNEVPELYPFEETILNAVDDFKANGGTFICHIHGHRHYSWVGYYEKAHGRQLGIITNSMLKEWYQFFKRETDTPSIISANVISVDTEGHKIIVQPFGNTILKTGGKAGHCTFDYNANLIEDTFDL